MGWQPPIPRVAEAVGGELPLLSSPGRDTCSWVSALDFSSELRTANRELLTALRTRERAGMEGTDSWEGPNPIPGTHRAQITSG